MGRCFDSRERSAASRREAKSPLAVRIARREAEGRLCDLVRRALVVPKKRYATRPTRASKERRLETKAHSQKHKRLRGRVRFDD